MGGDIKEVTKPVGNRKITQDTVLTKTHSIRASTPSVVRTTYFGSNATLATHAHRFGTDKEASQDPAVDYSGLGQSQRQRVAQSLLSALRDVSSPMRDAKQVPLFNILPVQDIRPVQEGASNLHEVSEGGSFHTDDSTVAAGVTPASGLTPLRRSPRMRPCRRPSYLAHSASASVKEESQLAVLANESLYSAKGVRLLSRDLGASASRKLQKPDKLQKSPDTVHVQPTRDKSPCRLEDATVLEMSESRPAAREHGARGTLTECSISTTNAVTVPCTQGLKENSSVVCPLAMTETSYRIIGDVGRKRRYSTELCQSPPDVNTSSGSRPPSKQRRINNSSFHSRPSEWKCDICFVHNTVLVTACCSCGIVRADAVLPPRAEFKSDGRQLAKLRQSASDLLWTRATAAADTGLLNKTEALTGGGVLDNTLQANKEKDTVECGPSEPLTAASVDSAVSATGEPFPVQETTRGESSLPDNLLPLESLNVPVNASAKRILFKYGQENGGASSVAPQDSLQPISLPNTQQTAVSNVAFTFGTIAPQPAVTCSTSGVTESKSSVAPASKIEGLNFGGVVPPLPALSTLSSHANLLTPASTSVASGGKRGSSSTDSDEPQTKKSPATALSSGTVAGQGLPSSIFPPVTATGAGFAFAPVVSFNFGGISSGASSREVFHFGAQKNEGAPIVSVPAAGLGVPSTAAFPFGAPGAAMMTSGMPPFGSPAEGNIFTTGQRTVKKATRRLAKK